MSEFRLECGACDSVVEAKAGMTTSECCDKPYLVRYMRPARRPEALPAAWAARPATMWRYRELLPLREGEEPVTLGEGGTPLLPLPRLGEPLGLDLLLKDESRNPTGSFKDRGLGAAVTRAVLDGVTNFVIPSAGNAGAALSAYAARAGANARVYIPRDTPEGVSRRCRAYGADLVEVDGLITDCGRLAAAYSTEHGAFDLSTLREPYRIEGKKTMMLEIVEALGWSVPDAIVYPTGGGTGLIGAWKALRELRSLGIVDGETRMYAVQSTGCAPIVRAWNEGRETALPWDDAETEAWGLRVPKALGDFLILRALKDTGGGAVAIPDADMLEAMAELTASEGVDAAIEGGAVLAAARVLRASGDLRKGERVVLFNTGGMLTY